MKIAYVLPEFVTEKEFGGLAVYHDNISRLLADVGHEIYIFVLSDRTETISYSLRIVVQRVFVDLRKIDPDIPGSFMRERSRVLKEQISAYIRQGVRFDLIQYANLWSLGLERLNLPTIVRVSSYQPLLRAADQEFFEANAVYPPEKVSDYLEEISMLRADAVYGPSKCIADMISKQIRRNVTVIESPFYPRVQAETAESVCAKQLKEEKYILTFGTIKALKGAKLIGDSIYTVLDTCRDLIWVFVGNEFPWKDKNGESISPKNYIRSHAREYADRVLFLGKKEQSELFSIIQNALFCVLPSRIDNLPNTCIEAMALGSVVIGTNGASFEQLIENGKSGFLVEREDREMLIKTIQYVYTLSTEKRAIIGEQAKKRIEKMAPPIILTELLNFYMEVVRSFSGMPKIDNYTQQVIEKYNCEMMHIAGRRSAPYLLQNDV